MSYFRKVVNKQLGEILIERGVLSHAQLEEVLVFQKEKDFFSSQAVAPDFDAGVFHIFGKLSKNIFLVR